MIDGTGTVGTGEIIGIVTSDGATTGATTRPMPSPAFRRVICRRRVSTALGIRTGLPVTSHRRRGGELSGWRGYQVSGFSHYGRARRPSATPAASSSSSLPSGVIRQRLASPRARRNRPSCSATAGTQAILVAAIRVKAIPSPERL